MERAWPKALMENGDPTMEKLPDLYIPYQGRTHKLFLR
ncbi:hypothetical protein D082_28890 [Synechocystis sp. PCC 6714]|nr:hypothetical protein D082_28890 [Synechocystis sp. PCC 6714]